jgi:hypothetical protein
MPDSADLYLRLPPDDSRHRDKIFIVDHHCCEVYLDEVVEELSYLLSGDNLLIPNDWKDQIEVSRCFVASVNKMLETQTDYVVVEDLDMLLPLGRAAQDLLERNGARWEFVTFFHNDEDTKKVFRFYQHKDRALEDRAERRAKFAAYPFVKQVEAPYAMVMDYHYLDGLCGMHHE